MNQDYLAWRSRSAVMDQVNWLDRYLRRITNVEPESPIDLSAGPIVQVTRTVPIGPHVVPVADRGSFRPFEVIDI